MWQDLSTYPHLHEPWGDYRGKIVLLGNATDVEIGYAQYDFDEETGVPIHDGWRLVGEGWEFIPTHWMELPTPPEAT